MLKCKIIGIRSDTATQLHSVISKMRLQGIIFYFLYNYIIYYNI